jgi:hypothetical protein
MRHRFGGIFQSSTVQIQRQGVLCGPCGGLKAYQKGTPALARKRVTSQPPLS